MSTDNYSKPNDTDAMTSARGIRLDVQGLRAIAVFAVMLYHADERFLKAGFIGVDVFCHFRFYYHCVADRMDREVQSARVLHQSSQANPSCLFRHVSGGVLTLGRPLPAV